MEKYAVIELNAEILRLIIIDVEKGGYFNVFDEITESIKIGQDVEKEGIIKPNKVNEALSVLKQFRRVCDFNAITKVIAVSTNFLRNAKNQKSFLEEVYNNTSFSFSVLSQDEELRAIYTGVVNSVDVQKGLLIDIRPTTTFFVMYNRRTILATDSLPYGSFNLSEKFDNLSDPLKKSEAMLSFVKNELKKINILSGLDEEVCFVGAGEAFVNLGRLARKVSHYPLDIENNYVVSNETITNVYDTVKELDLDKTMKLKGISASRADALTSGICIAKAFVDMVNAEHISISSKEFKEGIIYNYVVPEANDKPLSDMLGYSIETIGKFFARPGSNFTQVYALSMMLYKQLKVMHKLSRQYLKPLRIAAAMYDCGTRIKYDDSPKSGFNIIINSNLFGISHRELLISAFACLCQDPDNFSLSDWLKYKDILLEDDLDAVRKLGTIISLASALDRSRTACITDICCDILGDSVIMKTVTKAPADFDILQGMKLATQFRKIFKKNLQII